jgi:hypothetical protein
MSSPVPRARNIKVAIPATIKPPMVTAAYFMYFNVVASWFIEHLIKVVALVKKGVSFFLFPIPIPDTISPS